MIQRSPQAEDIAAQILSSLGEIVPNSIAKGILKTGAAFVQWQANKKYTLAFKTLGELAGNLENIGILSKLMALQLSEYLSHKDLKFLTDEGSVKLCNYLIGGFFESVATSGLTNLTGTDIYETVETVVDIMVLGKNTAQYKALDINKEQKFCYKEPLRMSYKQILDIMHELRSNAKPLVESDADYLFPNIRAWYNLCEQERAVDDLHEPAMCERDIFAITDKAMEAMDARAEARRQAKGG